MQKIIGFTLFCIILVTLLANPAPVSIEIPDVMLIAFPCFIGILCLSVTTHYKIHQPECNLLIAVSLYLSYLLTSLLIGLMNGVPLLNVLRSIGPYINFFPLLLMGLLPARLINPWMIGSIFIAVGLMQASYQIYLYLSQANGVLSTLSVLRGRITLIDPRTTLPIVLSIAVLPLAFFTHKNIFLKGLAITLILLGLVGAAATLTRSILLAIFVSWLTFLILYLYQRSQADDFSFTVFIKKFCIGILLAIGLILLISLIPKIYMLEQGLLARFYYYSSSTASADYSNGRLYDEWLPALHAWVNSGVLGIFFGIGAGTTFTVLTGEERTYIHNLFIYSLVYGGVFGLFACLWMYFTVFKLLVTRALQSNQLIYLGFASLLIGLFSYGQLFAVHKGLAFNAMLFLMITLALVQPATKST